MWVGEFVFDRVVRVSVGGFSRLWTGEEVEVGR